MGGAEISSMLDFNGTRAAFLLQILEMSHLQSLPCVVGKLNELTALYL